MKQEHKCARVLRWIADGEELQTQGSNGSWLDTGCNGALMDICEGIHPDRFRIKPRTVMCNGVEVPAPESVAPTLGARYYLQDISEVDEPYELEWNGTPRDKRLLNAGVVYLDKDACIARTKAMLITTQK